MAALDEELADEWAQLSAEDLWVALLSNATCLINTTSSVFYGITCLTRLVEFAALFVTFEERTRVRQVAY